MPCLISVPDRHMDSLLEFKSRHAGCGDASPPMDGTPGEHFEYAHVPSTLGGVTEVRCACGAKWVLGDDDPYEAPAASRADKERPEAPNAVVHSVRILHLAMTRPGVVLGKPGDGWLRDVEMLWHGMELALFHAPGCGMFDQIIMEWTSLLYEGLGYPEDTITNLMEFRYSDAYLEKGMDEADAMRLWDRHLCEYMWREWPAIAEGARLPLPSDGAVDGAGD